MARIVLDEDVHKSLALLLEEAGHEVTRIQDEGLAGSSDSVVFDFAQSRDAILITCDLGIADARVLSREKHAGVILLRVPNEISTKRIDEEIVDLLPRIPLDEMDNLLAVVELGRVRIRGTGL